MCLWNSRMTLKYFFWCTFIFLILLACKITIYTLYLSGGVVNDNGVKRISTVLRLNDKDEYAAVAQVKREASGWLPLISLSRPGGNPIRWVRITLLWLSVSLTGQLIVKKSWVVFLLIPFCVLFECRDLNWLGSTYIVLLSDIFILL